MTSIGTEKTRHNTMRILLALAMVIFEAAVFPAPVQAEKLAPTPASVEGPYYKTGSPKRTSLLEKNMSGTRLVLTGHVRTTNGASVKDARLDFWQADAGGRYDNEGYRLRGHQFTDDAGRYSLETVVPGVYGGRTPHVHVKIQAPNGTTLTTQLFLPGDPHNRSDWLYNPALTMQTRSTENGREGNFDFVLNAGH